MNYILSLLEPSVNTDVLASAAICGTLGFLFHLGILQLTFEFELIMYHFIATSILSYFGIVSVYIYVGDLNLHQAVARASTNATAFNIALLGSVAGYRVFLHRCRSFPGPPLAKVTKFYATYLSYKNVQYYKDLEKMHEKYGDFVRVGPRQISIMRKSAIPLLYGSASTCRKSSWYSNAGNDPTKVSIGMMRDEKAYRLRRRAWDRALSFKSIASYEPRIKDKVDILVNQLRRREGASIDITKWSMLFSFDLMGAIGFGKDFKNLENGEEHPAIQGIHKHMTIIGILGEVPWLMNLLSSIPGAAAGFAEFFDFCASEMKAKQAMWNSTKAPQDIVSWLLKAVKEKDVSASPSKQSLADDSRSVIIAGSDTSANTLANVMYYLTKHTKIQTKLHRLIDDAVGGDFDAWTYDKVKKVTYLDDIINEALRLKPPVLQIPPRETPANGIQVDEIHIPGNVNVSIPTILIMRDPRWWKEPNSFIPERFGELRTEMATEGAPFIPFSMGTHACPGSNLGLMSLRISISVIVQNFSIEFAPGEDGEAFDKEFLDTPLIYLPPLHLRLMSRHQV